MGGQSNRSSSSLKVDVTSPLLSTLPLVPAKYPPPEKEVHLQVEIAFQIAPAPNLECNFTPTLFGCPEHPLHTPDCSEDSLVFPPNLLCLCETVQFNVIMLNNSLYNRSMSSEKTAPWPIIRQFKTILVITGVILSLSQCKGTHGRWNSTLFFFFFFLTGC